VNDSPVLGANSFVLVPGGTLVLSAANISATDVDDASSELVFSIGGIANGYFALTSSPGAPITSFTQAQVLAGQVQFVQTGSGDSAFQITVSDGSAAAGPYAANITYVRGGGAPALTPGSGSGGPADVTPPTLPPSTATAPAGLPGAGATTFLRVGGGGEQEGGEEVAFAEIRPVAVAAGVNDRVTTPEGLIPPVRVQGDVIETAPQRGVIEVEPVRAEMQVIPTRYNLDLDEEERQRIEVVLNSVRITGLALSVGAVWWAARAAGLVASLLASTPAWRHVDPLPVLGRDEEEEEEWDDSAQDQDKKDDEHRAAWVLEGDSRA
jgi:hypothetical protein